MVDSKLTIPVNFKGSQPQVQRLKKQDEDDHWISEEELYTEGSSDEEKLPHSSRKYNPKGLGWEEVTESRNRLVEDKKSVEGLEEELQKFKSVNKIHDIRSMTEGLEIESEPFKLMENENIEVQMSEMKELDRMLKIKAEEVKMAKLERMHEEEQSQNLLQELSEMQTSEAIKQNSEQYLKLLKTEANNNSDDNIIAYKAEKRTKKEKVKCPERATINGLFIKRNIQLAKCGDGVLSLTDEEKQRLQTVLMDVEDPTEKSKDSDFNTDDKMSIPTENHYALNNEIKKILEEIDRKLEKYEKMKFPLRSVRNIKEKASAPSENMKEDDNEKNEIKQKPHDFLKNEFKRLKKVDDLLSGLNSTTYEEIDPLYDEDLQFLIEESKQSLSVATRIKKLELYDDNVLNQNSSVSSCNQIHMDVQDTPSKEEISELISVAKNVMPNFKFRYEY